jgi:hypothetical protein
MGEDPKTHFGLLKEVQLEHTNLWFDYWQNCSDYDTWQFWVVLCLLILPLILLMVVVDKRKALRL